MVAFFPHVVSLLVLAPVAPSHDRLRVDLDRVPIAPGEYGLAPGIRTELPAEAWRAKIDGTRYLFFDLDADGVLEPGSRDGITIEGSFNVVFLPEALLLPEGQYTPVFEGETLHLVRQELDVDPRLLAQVAPLTEMRIRGGRTPVVVDEEACRHAELHLEYLRINDPTKGGVNFLVHREDPLAPGYSEEGERAGRASIIGVGGSFREDLEGWYASAFHGVRLLDPRMQRIGVARNRQHSLLFGRELPWRGLEPVMHPADGQTEVPLGFTSLGEFPNPVPGTTYGRGCGFPVTVMLPGKLSGKEVVSFELTDPRGRKVKGHLSYPRRPANAALPDNMGCVFFIPKKELAANKRYEARLELDGTEPLVWSFTTRGGGRR